MKIEFHNKELDKNISLHFFTVNEDEKKIIRGLVYEIGTPCFLQGDSDCWLMIEFWTKDLDGIMEAVEYVEEKFGTKVQ